MYDRAARPQAHHTNVNISESGGNSLEAAGGRGGGRPDFAQGGGDGARMRDAVAAARAAAERLLRE